MNTSLLFPTLFALIPMAFAFLGGFLSSLTKPSPKALANIQHFVSGIVIGAVAVELIPQILGHNAPFTIGLGFICGVAAVIVIHSLSHLVETNTTVNSSYPLGIVFASGLDLLIDGILIGISFLAGRESGIFIAASLSFCAFFLILSVGSTLTKRQCQRGSKITTTLILGLLLPFGAWLGSFVLRFLPSTWLIESLAFGIAALLYLGCEELLFEAHESAKDNVFTTVLFFLGFLIILLFRT